ncbi:MAG: DNA-binding response regulator [Alphaproteobacteria bacterium]|nr:MAG: DNA-binding response regulator [Alphaproteobacteria bacterium]
MSGLPGAHLLVIGADARLRDPLCAFLRGRGFLVSAARDEAHAGNLLQGLEFDLILCDGDSADAKACLSNIATPVIHLGHRGAKVPDGATFLEKPASAQRIAETVGALLGLGAERPARTGTIVLGRMRFDPESGVLRDGSRHIRLTATEAALLRTLAARPGEPMTREQLVACLGRGATEVKPRAIDVQITRLRRKLEDDPRAPRVLQTIRRAGYALICG